MEEQLIAYLLDEGFVNSESSAYAVLDVISESFYEYLLNEVLSPEEIARRRRVNLERRQQLGTTGRSEEERRAVAQRGSNRPASSKVVGYTATSGMRNIGGAEFVSPTQGKRRDAATKEDEVANEIINSNPTTGKRTTKMPDFVVKDEQGRPIGRRRLNAVNPKKDVTVTMVDPKGRPLTQVVNTTADQLRAAALDKTPEGGSRTQKPKPQQTTQPQTQTKTTTRLPRQEPRPQTPQPRRQRQAPNPSTGTRGNPNRPNRIMGIQRQNPQ